MEADMEKREPAVFLDRDGTLIEDRGHLSDPEEAVFFGDTIEALTRLQARARLFIVTNQSGVGAGVITAAEVERVNAAVVDRLARAGIRIEAVYTCPHRRDEGCGCIKPRPYFLEKAAREHMIDLSRSFVVGDHPHDAALGNGRVAGGIFVLTGHGLRHRGELPAGTLAVPGIREAADWILTCHGMWRQEMENPGQISRAAACLGQGGVVAFPTETVYGLGASVFDATAVARIFEIKARPRFDPLIVHVDGRAGLDRLAARVPPAAEALINRFWPGPLTLILPKTDAVPDLVTAGLPSVAVRMPRHPLALELIRQAGVPLAAPSANPFGQTSPTSAAHVRDGLGSRVDFVLDGGDCPVGIESTIVSLCTESPTLLRPGAITQAEIEAVIGTGVVAGRSGAGPIEAPGMLGRHYAPRTRFVLVERMEADLAGLGARLGLLAWRPPVRAERFVAVEVLAENGDPREAAVRLFSAMRRLDGCGLDAIVAERAPDTGIGVAINDRLARAASSGTEAVAG